MKLETFEQTDKILGDFLKSKKNKQLKEIIGWTLLFGAMGGVGKLFR